MRALGIVAILAVGLAGCGGDSGSGGGTATATGIVGTWHLDVDHLKVELGKFLDKMVESAPEAQRPQAMKARDAQLALVGTRKMSLTADANGTYAAKSMDPTDGESTIKGTWTKKADGIFTIQQTHEDGKESKEPAFDVRMEDGALYGRPSANLPFDARFKR